MSLRFTQTILGATGMIVLGAALVAAQDTSKVKPRSDRRIPISKEAPGEVVRTDTVTVTVYKTDTLTLTQRVVDTLRLTNTVTVTRVDTVAPIPPPLRLPNGFYAGLAAGFTSPAGALYTPNAAGGTAQAQLGWQNAKQVFGFRLDANGAWPGKDSEFSNLQGQARLMNFSADAKAQLPFVNHLLGATHRFALYGIGGYTYTMYKNVPMRVDSPTGTGLLFVPGTDNWHRNSGWNAGGGASMLFGHSELFVESRVLAFDPSNAPMVRQIPIVFGMNWY
jgi:hypothetical protein